MTMIHMSEPWQDSSEVGKYHSSAAIYLRVQAALEEARRILADVEPDEPMSALYGIERLTGSGRLDDAGRVWSHEPCVGLAESLASATAPGGLLDRLADAVL